ncbi:MAG: glycosyltransferase family 2 protein [Flavobacteriales bacterium]|jgi:dolichol-phosphate mannosyltransferase|nr:glycosyltransferase family 2 protein [Flavobacteriales bacterium]
MQKISKISIVSPVYGAEKIVNELVAQIEEGVKVIGCDYEIILVEDASPDKSWEQIVEVAQQRNKVFGYKLSRNFGQHAAIKAGLSVCTGDVAIVMDCDLQDNPKYIKELVEKYYEGNDIVYTYKKKRSHSKFKNITAVLFNLVLNFLLENKSLEADKNVGAYSLISKKVVKAFNDYNDYQFHYLLVLRWLGFSSGYVEIEHNQRFEGESSYTFKKLIKHAGVAILYQSEKLLRLSIYFGGFVSFFSFLGGVYIIISYFISSYQSGWASIVVLLSFSLGVILVSIGVLGVYLGKMFEQVKGRPQFVFDRKTENKS